MNPQKKTAEEILPIVYEELHKLAISRMSKEMPGQTLSATALVHEAFLRLTKNDGSSAWDSKSHFFAAAAQAMRRILIDIARQKKSIKRGRDCNRIDLELVTLPSKNDETTWGNDFLELNEAIDLLEQDRPESAQVMNLRYFAGLTMDQAAEVMGVSSRTAQRHWAYAKAWLTEHLLRNK